YPGVELTWKPGHDDHWLSYYEVVRNNQVLDKVAKGNFYFDHSAGADVAATYQVRSVDGAQTAISFAGKWQRETDLQPAYEGTISGSDETGASFSFGVKGTKFTWFSKL